MAQLSKTSRLVLPDSQALSVFENDSCVKILDDHHELPGYELYIVEQWAASRQHLSSLITTFTGLVHHKIKVYILEIPLEEKDWSDRLRAYIQNISQAPARRKETALGTLMVTNLSSFASSLHIVNIPGGDYDEYRDIFVVNENLKRLGCAGRAGLNLCEPSGAAASNFRQLYYTHENVPITEAAVELVRLCQIALVLYAQLANEYTDGLLCDATINAIKDWWIQIGSEHINKEPMDGILGPTTVAALLGLLQGARIRLQALNCPIGKDVFDARVTKRAIEAFQKLYRLNRTRRFDPKTLDRLHSLTAKYVNSKEWMVPRAVKSTIPQLGKGGEMVMGMVSNKDKANIDEIETSNMATLAATATGDSAKWLWHGRRGKPIFDDALSRLSSEDEIMSGEDATTKGRKRDIVLDRISTINLRPDHFYSNAAGSTLSLNTDRDQSTPKHVLKSVTGRFNDAKSGLGRRLDSVGIHPFRGHSSKLSKDVVFGEGLVHKNSTNDIRSPMDVNRDSTAEDQASIKDSIKPVSPQRGLNLKLPPDVPLERSPVIGEELVFSPGEIEHADKQLSPQQIHVVPKTTQNTPKLETEFSRASLIRSTSDEPPRRTPLIAPSRQRALSFDDVSDALALQAESEQDEAVDSLEGQLANDKYHTESALVMRKHLFAIRKQDLAIAQDSIANLQDTDTQFAEDISALDKQYFTLLAKHDTQQQSATDTITTARTTLGDTLVRVEGVMAKLEYELNMLSAKVDDVEDSVGDFENQVLALETRARALEPKTKPVESLPWRLFRMALGLA